MECPVCGTVFRQQKGRVARNKITTCSRECRSEAMKGEANPRWKGGTYLDPFGYRHIQTPTGYRLEHRMVMEQMIGRPLLPAEVVHHRNEQRADNRPENLQLFENAGQHTAQAHSH